MDRDERTAIAARLMSEFATRTGLPPSTQDQQRYLWTDAFAVCNFLELFNRTGDQKYQHCARDLIDRVHQVLGRYRCDDARSGWISGLTGETGQHHPTAGGLRIGKPLKERDVGEPLDERLEWDRDGQYFHYLTKWIHAVCLAASVIGDPNYSQWAVELGEAAFRGFVRRLQSGEIVGVYWKMSTDLSRPLVAATGLHDALDGFITFREAQYAIANTPTIAGAPDLGPAIEALSALCRHRDWTSDDPLGLGGLLFDACRLYRLMGGRRDDARLGEELMDACWRGTMTFLGSRSLMRPASHRLAFRELGLAIGLRALPIIGDAITKKRGGFDAAPELPKSVESLLKYEWVGDEILDFWLSQAQHPHGRWQEHQNINDVMLATTLIPGGFLSVDFRIPADAS